MKQSFWLRTTDNVALHVVKWTQPEQPKAIVQLAHGMVEHIGRYDAFASFLAERNIYVYGNDHRGHGKTGENQGLFGYFSDTDGFEKVADDLYVVTQKMKEDYPNTPIILLGHSMGSFLARQYIQKHSEEIVGVILSGTTHATAAETKLAKKLASLAPPEEKAELLNKIIFGSFNLGIENPATKFDWLTRDKASVESYVNDPFCGFVPTGQFFYDLFTGLEFINDASLNKGIRTDLPMLLISGDKDPVGRYARNVWKAARMYQKMGLQHVLVRLVHGGRHEVLSETNQSEIYDYLYQWINSALANQTNKG